MHTIVAALALASSLTSSIPRSRVIVVGHRGARAELPENTLPSFEHALAHGADAIELDVHETQDRVLVVHHDADVNFALCTQTHGAPIAPGTKLLALTYAQLTQLECGSKTDPHFPRQKPIPGARIPKLAEALALAKLHDKRVFLEVKRGDPSDTPPLSQYVDDVVREIRAARMPEGVLVISFDADVIALVKQRAPDVPTGLLITREDEGDVVARARALGARALVVDHRRVTRALVEQAHASALKIVPWTVNDANAWRALQGAGVDGIITDDPRGLADALAR